jgi:small subunit ribosomal protein S13
MEENESEQSTEEKAVSEQQDGAQEAVEETEPKEQPAVEPDAAAEPESKQEDPAPEPKKPEPESKQEDPAPEPKKPEPEPKAQAPEEKKEAPKEKVVKEKKDKLPKQPKKPEEEEEVDEDFKYIVRIANTDLSGHKTVEWGLTGITGIGFRLATVIADFAKIPRTKKMGKLTDEEVETLEEYVKDLQEKIPPWLMNRQKDINTGDDTHIFGPDIELTLRDDLNRLKMIRCYRGIRHEQGQKVRGQRTRANGRKGATVGVMKKAVRQKQAGGKK